MIKRLSYERSRVLLLQLMQWYPDLTAEQCARLLGEYGVELELRTVRPVRSLDQNARYWAIVGALAAHIGDTKSGVHEDLLQQYHGYDVIESVSGRKKTVARGRSKRLSKTDFSDLMMLAEKAAALLGVEWEEAG